MKKNLRLLVTLPVLALLILCPLAMIFARTATVDGGFLAVLMQEENLTAIGNSLLLGVCVVLGATVIAMPLAYLLARTSIGRHKWLDIVLMIPFMTPPYIASMGWILFMQKRGLFQQLFPWTGAWSQGFFSFFGLVLVMSLHVFPFMTTLLKNAMLNVPASLEESGAVFGAGFGQRLRKIFLPLISGNYAIGALLVFVKTLSEYGTPATLGKRIGFEVFTTSIHRHATTSPIDFGRAASLSAVLVAVCMGAWLLQSYITSRRTYALVGGKGSRVRVKNLRGWKRVGAWAFIVLVLLVSVGVPYFSTILTSLIKLRGYGLAAGNFTFDHYIELFTENTKGIDALTNSVWLALASATLAALLGTLVVAFSRKAGKALRRTAEGIALLPQMLPGIVLVIGIMLFWNALYKVLPLYNTAGILVVAYVAMFLPYTVQYVGNSYTQLGRSLTQAARVFGASERYAFRRVTLPLIFPGILSGWMMTFIIAFRELVTASLIAPPNMLVVSTYIMREFEQGSVSVGMAMAVLCVLISTTALLLIRCFTDKQKGAQV